MEKNIYDAYVDILKEELIPAMGCTEPIAVAYAGALARKVLGALPERVILCVSGNIVKNVKSVIVPHTGGRKGLKVAVAVGICCGDADQELEVISGVTEQQLKELDQYLEQVEVKITESTANCPFDIQVTAYHGDDRAYARIIGHHTNVVSIKKNDTVLVDVPFQDDVVQAPENRKLLDVAHIVQFADEVEIPDVQEVLQRQIDYNMAIAQAGMDGSYGATIGKILLKSYGNCIQNRAKAWAAAGSDARMCGCELPVVINSGSGNQGITASVPVIVYARELKASEEQLYRALTLSNLTTIHEKTPIGRLSAYCGAISAGAGAGAGIAYLCGGGYEAVIHTVVNALAIVSGVICDGAKASCAAKIATAVEAGLLGYNMYIRGQQFRGGDGIVAKGVENSLRNVGRLGKQGMKETNREIIDIMVGCK